MARKVNVKKLTLAGLFIAIGLVLPFITGQIPQIGQMLLPMHIPVFLCGMICGWPWGFAVGLILPLLRSLLFGMPALYPNALVMSAELATYGSVIGLVYAHFKNPGTLQVYISLIVAMIAGRLVWGIVKYLLLTAVGNVFTWKLFVAGGFVEAVPGIIIQLILIPAIMALLKRSGYLNKL